MIAPKMLIIAVIYHFPFKLALYDKSKYSKYLAISLISPSQIYETTNLCLHLLGLYY